MLIDFIIVVFFMAIGVWIWHSTITSGLTFKSGAIAVMIILLSVASYWSIKEYRGYPVVDDFQGTKEILFSIVEDPTNERQGRIYLWMRKSRSEETTLEKLFKLTFKFQPRAYEIPWTKENAKKIRQAQEQSRKGMRVRIKKKKSNREGGELNLGKFVIEMMNPRDALSKN